MGAKVSIKNDTPYSWYYSRGDDNEYNLIGPGGAAYYDDGKKLHCYIHLRYGNNSWDSFVYEFNTHKGDARFTLSLTPDHSQIQLYCSSERLSQYCPNYGLSHK